MSKAKYKIKLPNGKMQTFILDMGRRSKLTMSVVDRELIVRVPADCTNKIINDFICSNYQWIEKVMDNENVKIGLPKTFEQGEKICLLGNMYTIDYIVSDKYFKPYLSEDKLVCATQLKSTKSYRVNEVTDFISQLAGNEISESMKRMSNTTGLTPTSVSIKSMTSRWGSCGSKGTISLNYKLIQFPKRYIDYVCVHELCHLKHLNHSTAFWALVEVYIPEWKTIRDAMKY